MNLKAAAVHLSVAEREELEGRRAPSPIMHCTPDGCRPRTGRTPSR